MGRRKHADPGVTVAVRLPTSRAMAIDFAANSVGRTRSEVLRDAIYRYLSDHQEALRQKS